jgi:hypothetical protein
VFNIEQVHIEQGDQTMRSSSRLYALKNAARARQVQAEIGRLLRQHYDVSSSPMPGGLAEIIKKMQSESQSALAFRRGIPNEQARRVSR